MNVNEPKTLKGSSQKAMQSEASCCWGNPRTHQTAGVEAETKSLVLRMWNMVNLTSRLWEAGALVRAAVGTAGRGNWNKQRPPCNGADRDGDIILPRKRADFQWVIGDERTGRAFTGGNSK